jgi:FkbM family methyltransferase
MKLKLQRVATLIEKFGLSKGLQLYLGLRKNNLPHISLPGIKSLIFLRPGTTDNAIFDQVFVKGEYSIPLSFEPSVIVDVGAHIGLFTVFMKNLFPEARFICVEPGKSNFQQLRKNTEAYQSIQIENAAIWNRSTSVLLQEQFDLGQSGLQATEHSAGETQAITMEMLFEKYSLSHIDILKLDIETAEKIVFANGYEGWLKRVRLIIIELHDWLEPGCAQVFLKAINLTFEHYRYTVCGENTVIENLDF